MDLIPSCPLISYAFTCSFCILSFARPRLWFHIHRYALSRTLCIFWISVAVHVWTMQSRSIVDSTTACTARAYVLIDNLDRQSHFLVLYQAAFPRCTLAFKSSFLPILVPSILVLFAASVPNDIDSSFPS